jgi:hypothetical protein
MIFQPEVSFCKNKWCENPGTIPASGNMPDVAKCGTFYTMDMERLKTGGITGRGVTPCPYGFLQKVKPDSSIAHPESVLYPYSGKNFQRLSPTSIFFQPDRPGYLPPLGDPRPLYRIGYEWRN